MSKRCAGWLCIETDFGADTNALNSLLGVFHPTGRHRTFHIGGYSYILGVSDWFLFWEGEMELAPTYEPIFDELGDWASFNVVNMNAL